MVLLRNILFNWLKIYLCYELSYVIFYFNVLCNIGNKLKIIGIE